MNKDNNTFTVAASSLDYSNLIVGSDSCVISNHKIPLEKVNGVIDRFEEETKARSMILNQKQLKEVMLKWSYNHQQAIKLYLNGKKNNL